jgi:sugar phosphate isomerase/epimerase
MRALRGRAIGCAAAAAAGAVLFAGAATAQAQRPATTGNGIPTGQMGVQMFNYGGWIGSGNNQGAALPPEFTVLTQSCLVDQNPAPGNANDTRQTDPCRAERLEALFKFLQRKGVTNIELFAHALFPSSTDIPGLVAYRALMDKYGLHAGGWHGSMAQAGWDTRVQAAKILGADYIGSGGVVENADGGVGSYADTLRAAQTLNALGKRSVEAGVGPTYIHNHTDEFDRQYVHNGTLKYAYDIIMEETDPRYVVGELDVFWSSDAFNDVSGVASANFIEKHGTRIQLLHIKDGINIPGQPSPTNSRSGSPRTTGTGELDFRPIFEKAFGRVRYYHQEHDGGTITDADNSLTNLKGIDTASVGTLLVKPPSFPSVPANTPGSANVVPVLVQNTGDQPLNITAVAVQSNGAPNDAGDFQIINNTCTTGGALAAVVNTTNPPTRGTCIVNVGFRPSKTNYTSVARLQFTSNSDSPTESVLLAARSTGDALGTVGGNVPSVLNLSITNTGGSFGTFVPALARTYDTALSAVATTTTGDALLSVTDWSTTAPGHLVNGAFSLPQAVGVRALGLGDSASTAFQPLSETAGQLVPLKAWSSPITAAPLTLGFRQGIGGGDVLRAGTYSKTLTFTLSTTTP